MEENRSKEKKQIKRKKSLHIKSENYSEFVYRVQSDGESEVSKLKEDEAIFAGLAEINNDPANYREAMSSSEKANWKKAIDEELLSMRENDVREVVDTPVSNQNNRKPNIIDSKWVFKRKVDDNGQEKYKARLVIRGFKDKNVYELRETYAPVSRLAVIRASLAIINKYDLDAVQLDVKTAFLNGILEDDVYMEIPEGVNTRDSGKSRDCKLKKTLYGLKVSPKRWNQRFTGEVNKLGLQRDMHDPCLFTWRKEGSMAFLVLYVDDIILASNCTSKRQEITARLCEVFKMRNLGEPKMFLT